MGHPKYALHLIRAFFLHGCLYSHGRVFCFGRSVLMCRPSFSWWRIWLTCNAAPVSLIPVSWSNVRELSPLRAHESPSTVLFYVYFYSLSAFPGLSFRISLLLISYYYKYFSLLLLFPDISSLTSLPFCSVITEQQTSFVDYLFLLKKMPCAILTLKYELIVFMIHIGFINIKHWYYLTVIDSF